MLFENSSNSILRLVSIIAYALIMPVRDARRLAAKVVDKFIPQWMEQASKRRVAIIVLGSILAEGFYALIFLMLFKFAYGQTNLDRLLDNYPADFLAGVLGGLVIIYQIYFSRDRQRLL